MTNANVEILLISNHSSFECRLKKKLLSCILFEKYSYTLALEMASPEEPALCQLYRHTFVACVFTV